MKAPSNVQYTGILHTATPFGHLPESQRNKYVLKAATAVGEDKDDAVKIMPGQTILLDMDKVMQLHVKSCRLDALVGSHNKTNSNSSSDAFTDAEISGAAAHTLSLRDKDLVQADATWTSAGDVGSLGAPPPVLNSRATLMAGGGGGSAPTHTTPSINTSSGASNTNVAGSALQGSISGWDQFKANKELFNVTGSYDENVYTTALDKSQFSASDRQRAEILAREIESSTTSNLHIAEERGHIMNQDYDEEDRYSGVLSKPKAPAASAATRNNATTAPIFTSTESASRPKKLNYAQAVAAAKSGEPNPPGFRLSGETNVTATSENGVDGATVSEAIEAKKKKNAPVKQLLKAAETKAGNEPVESKPVSKVVEEVSTEIEVDEEPHQAMPEELSSDATDEPKFKLRASAKSFSFNINAKTFMPMPPPPPPPPPPQQQHFIDPSTAMPVMMAMGAPMMPGGALVDTFLAQFCIVLGLVHN